VVVAVVVAVVVTNGSRNISRDGTIDRNIKATPLRPFKGNKIYFPPPRRLTKLAAILPSLFTMIFHEVNLRSNCSRFPERGRKGSREKTRPGPREQPYSRHSNANVAALMLAGGGDACARGSALTPPPLPEPTTPLPAGHSLKCQKLRQGSRLK
jgi:hypothetical protein